MSALAQGWLLRGLRRFTAAVMQSRLAVALRAAKDNSCQPEALRESQASFASERTVVTNMSCRFCPEQDGSHSAALHPVRLPRETPRAMAARSSVFHCKKKNQLLYFGFSSVYFLNLSAAKPKC